MRAIGALIAVAGAGLIRLTLGATPWGLGAGFALPLAAVLGWWLLPGALSTERRAVATALAFGVFGALGIPAIAVLASQASRFIAGHIDPARAIGEFLGGGLLAVLGFAPILFIPCFVFATAWVVMCRLVFSDRFAEEPPTADGAAASSQPTGAP